MISNIKVFTMENENCKGIANSKEEILEMLNDRYVQVIIKLENYVKVIGLIKNARIESGDFYGDILTFPHYQELENKKFEFANYSVLCEITKEGMIFVKYIDSIEIREVK